MSLRLGFTVLLALAASGLALDAGSSQAVPRVALDWEPSTGPFTGIARVFSESESGTLFAWVQGEIFRSRDDGVNWTRCESQPPADRGATPWMFAAQGRLYAMNDPGRTLYASDDECASSRLVPAPAGSRGFPETVSSLGGRVLAAYQGYGLFRLQDDAGTWTRLDAPPNIQAGVTAHGDHGHLVASGRLYASDAAATTWTALNSDPVDRAIEGGRSLLAAAAGGLMRSGDHGRTWVRIMPAPFTAAVAGGDHVHVATDDGIARSLDDGTTWRRLPRPGHPRYGPFALYETRAGTLLAGTGLGVFRWSSTEARWTMTGVPGRRVLALAVHKGAAYVSIDRSLLRSDDAGLTWSRLEPVFTGSDRPVDSTPSFARLFPGHDGTLRASVGRGLMSSSDGGRTWASAGLDRAVHALVQSGGAWYAATSQGVFRAEDAQTWVECSTGLENADARALVATSRDLIVESGRRLFRSTNGCRSWSPLPMHPFPHDAQRSHPEPWRSLLGDPSGRIGVLRDGVSHFVVDQRTWVAPVTTPPITDAASDAEGRYWLGSTTGVLRLDTKDSAWHLTDAGLSGVVRAVAAEPGSYVLAAVEGRGVFRARLR